MSLSDDVICLSVLMQADLPGFTLRMCDGGMVKWGADVFETEHPVFGTVMAVETLSEGLGDTLPEIGVTMVPDKTAANASVAFPAMQGVDGRIIVIMPTATGCCARRFGAPAALHPQPQRARIGQQRRPKPWQLWRRNNHSPAQPL